MNAHHFSKPANNKDGKKKPEPIIEGYLSKTAPFDFDVFMFNPDDDDEKRFYIRKLFSQFQKIDSVVNFELDQDDNNYSETRIKQILYSFHQLNHFVYSRPLNEKEIFLLLQYGTMLIQVSAFEVNAIFQQNYKLCQQREDDEPRFCHFHLDLYEEIFIFIDFLQKNKKGILTQLKSYGQNVIIQKLANLPNYNKFSSFDKINPDALKKEITNIKNMTYSENTNSFLLSLNQLEFCVTLHNYLMNDYFLFEFTKNYTQFYKLIDAMLALYKYDYDLFANAPTYFRLFFLFFQYKQNNTNKLKEVFNLFRFTIQDLFQHLFFGKKNDKYNKYIVPLSFDMKFTEKKYNQSTDVIGSLYSYAKTSHLFSLFPIGASKTSVKIQYAFYPIAETAFNILSNQLNAWCIKMSEVGDDELLIDYPEILLKYIRHWTAHEYILYQQYDVNISESTTLAMLQNATSPNSSTKESSKTEQSNESSETEQSNKSSETEQSKEPPKTEQSKEPPKTEQSKELSKTYRVIYHYLSFLTGIIQNRITKLDYQKNAHAFYEFQEQNQDKNKTKTSNQNDRKNKDKKKKKQKDKDIDENDNNENDKPSNNNTEIPPKIHPFLNFNELYNLAKLLGPDGIRFISDNVMYYLKMNFKGLIDLFNLIVRILKRKKKEDIIYDIDQISEIDVHQNKIAEYFAAIGNLAYLRELLKFVSQTYLRNYNPRLYFDIQRIMAKHKALKNFKAENKNLDYPASYEEFKVLIDKFDMSDDCGITKFLLESYENIKKKKKIRKNDNNDNNNDNNNNNNNNDNNNNNNNNDNNNNNNDHNNDDDDDDEDYSYIQIDDSNKSDFQNVAESYVLLAYVTFNSDYFEDKKNDQISFLAIARGIDEFFSLLFYNNHVREDEKTDLTKIFKIHEQFINLIDREISANSSTKDKKASEKMLKFIKIYFQESSYYHQGFVVGQKSENRKEFKKFKGREKSRDTPKDFLLIENIEWLDFVRSTIFK